MDIPFEPIVFGLSINVHLILEYVAFFTTFQYYLYLRRIRTDTISSNNRLSIILAAAIGALMGSRVMGFLENPQIEHNVQNLLQLLNVKTIMGGLFGALLAVELAKRIINEKQSSGDLFTLPLIVGISIGRVGCFLSGTNEFTYGKVTTFFTGMDLGDGVLRHPIALYELLFLLLLYFLLKKIHKQKIWTNGKLFQFFMLSYFGFRFLIEFLKPNVFFLGGLSSIQWLCIICFLYYQKTIISVIKYAYQKI